MTISLRTLACIALLSCMTMAPSRAEDIRVGDLVISQPWSRATPGGAKVGTGYLTIENKGSSPDRLLTGSTDAAKKLEVHEMAVTNGVMTMRAVDNGIAIEPGKTVSLAPGGYHLMLIELNGPLKQGEQVPVTLKFEKAGEVKISLDVQGIGAQAPVAARDAKTMTDHHDMKM